MRKSLLAIVAVAPALALARTPFGAMSAEEIKAADKERWGKQISMTGPVADEFHEMESRLIKLTEKMKAFCKEHAVIQAERTDLVIDLANALQQPLVPASATRSGKLPTSGVDEPTRRGYERLNAFKSMALSLDRKSRQKIRLLVMDIAASRQIERHSKWSKAQDYLEHRKYTESFREIDKSYEEFMGHVDGFMVKKPKIDVTGTEMLLATRLGKYADSNCKKKAWLDADVRVIDRYLLVMKQDEMDEFEKNTASIKKRSSDALATVLEDFDFYEDHAINVEPSDRKTFDAFFSQFSAFVEQVDRILVADSEKMLAKAKDTSTEIGMLRKNTGFSPHKAFLAAGPTQTNGCPGYSRRLRVLLEDCKKRYLAALKAANEYRKQHYLENPTVTDWQ